MRSGELGVLRPSTSMWRGEGPRERGSCLPTTTLGEGTAEEQMEEEEQRPGEEEGDEEEEDASVDRGWNMELMAAMGRFLMGSGSRGDGMRSWKSSSIGM